MSVEAVKEFYEFSLHEKSIQDQLIKTTTIDDFISLSVKLGNQFGYVFSENDMSSTMSGLGESQAFSDLDFGSPWINKIMEIGWVPMGYSKY